MEGLETMDRECAALGGLFQQVVNDMKTGVPHYEDFISKAGKLHSQVKNTILALGGFLDSFQKIADAATNTKGATREIGACLTRIVIRHKAMEARMKTLSSALLDCMVLPLQEKMEDWKKIANTLDKDHSKEYKKLRQELKKKVDNHTRIAKKQKKSSKGAMERDPKLDQSVAEVSKQLRTLHDVEKTAVRKVLVEERSRYCTFVACLKPVLGEETAMMVELQQLEEVMSKLDKHTEDPFKLPEASEQVVSDVRMSSGGVVFQTPPSSPSSLGSRKSSMCSISSASSSGGSTNSPSHQPHQHRHGRQPQAGVGAAMGPMRLSSISSQDSGFTSQDTLFLRPGSPHQVKTPNGSDQELSSTSGGSTPGSGWTGGLVPGMPGHAPLTDRPHTISSAYEKERQRPVLQPYTFNTPIDRTIQEEDEGKGVRGGGSEEQLTNNKPPIPKRSFSLERPSVPGKTQAAILARQRMAQGSNLPNFMCDQPDMVVPQPVYMNMSDLANLAAARANEQQAQAEAQAVEDTADLKTPTAEDLGVIGSGSGTSESGSSLGESSGYGSQNTVRLDEAASTSDGHYAVPAPAPLLDASKYRNSLRGRGALTKGRERSSTDSRPSLQRPFSFTQGYIPEGDFSEALGAQLGVGMNNASRGTILRRSSSQASKPAPPTRRTSSISSQGSRASLEENPGENFLQEKQNTIPERQVSWVDDQGQPGSNSTTPRGSMEFLPPPPPHLLHSDGEEEVEEDGKVISKRGMSVADSIKALQTRQAPPHPSPGTLRRTHSVAGSSPHHTDRPTPVHADAWSDRNKIRARLEASLNSPGRPRPTSPGHALQDQIYAPVAALQQKIQQQQQARLMHQQGVDPAMVQHPPGPVLQHPPPNHQPGQHPPNHQSPEGEQYGFGMQFHLQSNNYYTGPQQQQQHPGPHHQQQQQQQQHPGSHQQQPQYTQQLQPIYNQQQYNNQQQPRPPSYNQQYNLPPPPSSFHQYSDQVMELSDPTLAQRPQPPDLRNGHGPLSNGHGLSNAPRGSSSAQYDQQTALRVRRWIETKSQPDVAKCRPVLNAEIQQGFCLRKTSSNNDRSGPRF